MTLLELMTARETLFMFARLKNLPERTIPGVVAVVGRSASPATAGPSERQRKALVRGGWAVMWTR